MTTAELQERAQRDAKLDADRKLSIKLQCRFCKYRMHDHTNNITVGCDYVSHMGKLRDRGNGPGDCRSFEPREETKKADRVARVRRSIQRSEADSIDKRFRE